MTNITVANLHDLLEAGDVVIVNALEGSQSDADELAYRISTQLSSVTPVRLHAPHRVPVVVAGTDSNTLDVSSDLLSGPLTHTFTTDHQTVKIADVHAELSENAVPVVVSLPGLEFDTIPPARNGKHENLFISMLRSAARSSGTYAICVTTAPSPGHLGEGLVHALRTRLHNPDVSLTLTLNS